MATTSKARSSMAANQRVSAATVALALTELDFDDGDGRNLSDFITDYFAEDEQVDSGGKRQNTAVGLK